MAWKMPGGQKRGRAVRIVIADDHVVLLESLAALLETQPDFAVVGKAVNGAQAVDLVGREHHDVLVLDLLMPQGDGFEVLRTLDKAGNRVASVVLTDSRRKGRASGAQPCAAT